MKGRCSSGSHHIEGSGLSLDKDRQKEEVTFHGPADHRILIATDGGQTMKKRTLPAAAAFLILTAAGSYAIYAECPDGAAFRSGRWLNNDWKWEHIRIPSTRCVETCNMITTNWPGFAIPQHEVCPGDWALEESNLEAAFWELGKGNPAVGVGNDSGYLPPTAWLSLHLVPQWHHGWTTDCPSGFDTYQGPGINGDWLTAGTDGCIKRNSCMGVLFNDLHEGRGHFYFATSRDEGGQYSDPAFQFGRGELVYLRGPEVRIHSPATAEVIISTPSMFDLRHGFSLDEECDSDVVVGYQLYQQVVPEGGAPPEKQRFEAWSRVESPLPLGASIPFSIGCGEFEGVVYLAGGIVFDSGFETVYLSEPVGPLPCLGGPTFAIQPVSLPVN
jgi:hypothetical protein